MSTGVNAIMYRCAFVVDRQALIWDSRTYQKRQHAYNRLDVLRKEKDYFLKYGRGQWEAMYTSGWKRDNNKKTVGINTVQWIEEIDDSEDEYI